MCIGMAYEKDSAKQSVDQVHWFSFA